MWKELICRHLDVRWQDSHTCRCQQCGKFGHWFEEGYAIWTRAGRRPEVDDRDGWSEALPAVKPQKKAG